MTIVNRSRKFIFVHVPKTAGTAVTDYFRSYARKSDLYVLTRGDVNIAAPQLSGPLHKHSTSIEIRQALGKLEFDNFFKFSVVRNPFSRAVSTFLFLKYKFRKWPKSDIMDQFQSADEFVTSAFFRRPGPGGIFRPQVLWLTDETGKMVMDHICRIEALDQDIAHVRRTLSLDPARAPVQRKNVSSIHPEARSISLNSGAAIDTVLQRYSGDFELLGYSRNPEKAEAEAGG